MKSQIYRDPVVEAYMPGVDRTLLHEDLKLTFEQRGQKLSRALQIIEMFRCVKAYSYFLATIKTTDDVLKYTAEQGSRGKFVEKDLRFTLRRESYKLQSKSTQ